MSINKSILTACIISGAIISAVALNSYADNQTVPTKPAQASTIKKIQQRPAHRLQFHKARKKHKKAWDLGLSHNMKLNAKQARTIASAALLMEGYKQYHIGAIKQINSPRHKTLYLANIVNKKNKTVRRIIVNGSNGHIKPTNKTMKMRLRGARNTPPTAL